MSRSCDLRQVEFLAPKVDLRLLLFSLGPPFTKSQKMGDLLVIAKMCHNSALRAVLGPPFAPKCCPVIELKAYVNKKIMRFATRCFSDP